jgi:hypothetical protein
MIEFFNSQPVEQALAWLLTFIILNGLYKLTKGEKARLTSWGLWLVVATGTVFIRLPQSYGFTGIDDWIPLIRLVTYIIVITLDILDWYYYLNLKKEKKEVITK